MKEYIKPEAELIIFESEDVTSMFDGVGNELGDVSNTLSDDESYFI